MLELSRAQVSRFRLSKHHLLSRLPKNRLEDAVSDSCCLQAQVLSSAEIGIWARVRDITRDDVQDALWNKHSLVKTWSIRGTLHLVASTDYPIYVSALSQRLDADSSFALPLDKPLPANTNEIVTAIRDSLNNRNLTRQELADSIVDRLKLGKPEREALLSGWGSMLHPAAFQGALCFGPSKGQNVTFVRPDQWIGKWKKIKGIEAVETLFRLFIGTYGPCTYWDFEHWWGWLRRSATKQLFDSIHDELEQVSFEGQKSWILKSDVRAAQRVEKEETVRLLPSWDCYVMFYSPRKIFIHDTHRPKLFSQLQGNFPALVIDGLAAGIWLRRLRRDRLEITVRPFERLSRRIRDVIREEANSLGTFLDRPVETRFSN